MTYLFLGHQASELEKLNASRENLLLRTTGNGLFLCPESEKLFTEESV